LEHRRIARAALWVALFALLGKLAAAAREISIAHEFGVSAVVDAYQLAVTFATWAPVTVVSVMSAVLVPVLVRLNSADNAAREHFLRELFGAAVLSGLGFLALTWIVGLPVIQWFASDLSANTAYTARSFAMWLSVLAPIMLLIGVHSAQLMARERHWNTLLEGLPPATIAILLILWPSPPGAEALICGTLLGYVFQAAWLRHLSKTVNQPVWPMFSWRSPEWQQISGAAGLMASGQVVINLTIFLDQYAAADVGDSAIATLGYANRVLTLFLAIGALAVARAALPVLVDAHGSSGRARARSICLKWAVLMLPVGGMVAMAAWIAAPSGLQILYERGAFTPSDTEAVATVFRFGVLQFPFFFSGLVLVQFLVSAGRFGTILLIAVGTFAIKFLMNALLTPMLGTAGITLASVVMHLFSMTCFLLTIISNIPKVAKA
jgi:peptidoglycan biosynthesis protein MviN/MurJ (putative lipid II flippase)